ncbi:class I SAM-dependent methyltransferase [Gammaproteobacteria bacterium]|nr:class I SAM-dependent methyltransferase [Gammaproteobacteria bacterium]
MSIYKNIGGKLNRIILKNKALNFFDSFVEKLFNIFPNRSARRYKSFIGNYLIIKAKNINIKKYTAKLPLNASIVDIGCAEGSLLFSLRSKYPNCSFYGCDSGYSSLFKNHNKLLPNLRFKDLNIYHKHYSPDGKNISENISLDLPSDADLIIMYDVLPYLNFETQKNYIMQISSSLKVGGEIILTAMLNTNSQWENKGLKGEFSQLNTDISKFLSLASEHNLIFKDFALGNWEPSRKRWDIRDADLLVLKKI